MKTKKPSTPVCIQHTLSILGDKWTALILNDLCQSPKTFSELESSLSPISPRTLSQRLSKLEEDKIIQRDQYNQRPPRYRYSLTTKGEELRSLITSMSNWGARYC